MTSSDTDAKDSRYLMSNIEETESSEVTNGYEGVESNRAGKNKRIVTIDLLRGVSMFLMVNIHIMESKVAKTESSFLSALFEIAYFAQQFNVLFWLCSAFGSGLSAISKIRKNKNKVSAAAFLMVLLRLFISIFVNYLGIYLIAIKGSKLVWLALGHKSTALEKNWHWGFNFLKLMMGNSTMVIRDILISTSISVLTLLLLLYFSLSKLKIITLLMSAVLINYSLGYIIPGLASLATFQESQLQAWEDSELPEEERRILFEWPPKYIPSASAHSKNNCFFLYPNKETGIIDFPEEYCAHWGASVSDVSDQSCLRQVEDAMGNARDLYRSPHYFSLPPDSAYPIRICDGWKNRDNLDCDVMSYDLLYLEEIDNKFEGFRYDENAPWYGSKDFPCSKPPELDGGKHWVEVAKVRNWLVPSLEEKIYSKITYFDLLGRGTTWQKLIQFLFKSVIGGYGILSYGMGSNTGVLLAYCISEYGWTMNILSGMFYSGIMLILLGIPEVAFFATSGILMLNHPGNVSMALGALLILYSFLAYVVEFKQTGRFTASRIKQSHLYKFLNRYGTISFTVYVCQYPFGWPIMLTMMGLAGQTENYCLTDQMVWHYGLLLIPPGSPCQYQGQTTLLWFFVVYLLVYNILFALSLYLWEKIGYAGSLEWIILKLFGIYFKDQPTVRFEKVPEIIDEASSYRGFDNKNIDENIKSDITDLKRISKKRFKDIFTAIPSLVMNFFKSLQNKLSE